MEWSLYDKDIFLEPLIFSNNKSQLDIVKEVLDAIKEGYKIIFIKGACGTGKSAIALNLARELGKTSIVVPVKPLQKQYEEDYTKKYHILKNNNEKLKITVIDGRNNHYCPFDNTSCDARHLPCTIEIKEKSKELLEKYIKMNPFVKSENFESIKDVRRKSIAPACPYWSPIIPNEVNYDLEDSEEIYYKGLKDKTFTIFKRKEGCGYYDQFMAYKNSDVIIFNSKKYELENIMDRKPKTELEVIDECDSFLDNLSNEKKINLDRLSFKLNEIQNKDLKELTIEINDLIMEIKKQNLSEEPVLIKNTKILELLKYFLNNPCLFEETEEELSASIYRVYEIAKYFENILNETYISLSRFKDEDIVTIVTVNLEKKLKEFLDKNKVFVMMSGTIHSEPVLRNVFGLKDFKIIEAETKLNGSIKKIKTGLENKFNYQFLNQHRDLYLKALSKCIEIAKKPILIQIHSFYDLPTEFESSKYNVQNIKLRDNLKDEQEKYKKGELVQKFKNKEIDVLYSTKCNRGVDFPGDICNSIIFTKYPFPNLSSLFWKVLRKVNPGQFDLFYFDKADREYIQWIYRGIRSKEDKIELLSPDLRVHTHLG
ncbi:MAG: DEAD/DEAH box helicase family protein [Nanoarchaeota archaeon]|nr:DEAD/DEAH box helicase family protein [Nanoarchaeota archaeon]MBU0963079.1 DEAD/DEAH box helicase family protein [Nanoarchaeota archaeon]